MAKKAVLLLNLGSPASTKVGDVRRYLREFLMDSRVIDSPAFQRAMVVHLVILPFRAKRTAEAYRQIWRPDGSPLLIMSSRQRDLVQAEVETTVALAMRYGSPSICEVVTGLVDDGVEEIFIMPLYPQYAMSSYETVVVRVMEEIQRLKPSMGTTLLQPFYDDPEYVDALLQSSESYLKEGFDKLIFSFHGLPERHLRKSDTSHAHCLSTAGCCQNNHPAHATCYRSQCFKTVEKFTARAGLSPDNYLVTFQSRLGRDPWLRPYTEQTLDTLGRDGVGKLLVMCPAFVTDCLETLEEIAIRGKSVFEKAGGGSLTLIPCMNDHSAWIQFLAGKIKKWLNA